MLQEDNGKAKTSEGIFMLETKKKYKILVIDDSKFNRVVMTSMLEKDYFLEEACDGKQAMLILEDHAEEFSLVLLDIVMPNMDGFEVLKAMKECGLLDFLPVIMISSEYTTENIETAYRLGAIEIIQRPYNERVICHRIANTIALSGKQRELSNALVNEVIQENETSSAMASILSHIVETRNGESGSHVQNIRNITRMLLEELMKVTDRYSFSKAEILLICTASSLHDIGKMTIPEEILNKPGKLTDDEFRIMKGHSMAGANMVDALRRKGSISPLIQMTYDICRWHHERYDGRGYPDGLKGEEIPITAQVVSVADVYDALVSERCYKPAYSPEQALQMILGGQCGEFNPLLLDCLSRIFDRLKNSLITSDSQNLTTTGIDPGQELIEGAIAHLHRNGMVTSERIMQTLTRERLRFKFFFNEKYPAFYYTVSPPVLHYNKAGMELFGVDEPIVELDRTSAPHEKYDHYAAKQIRRRLSETTNEHPMVKETILLNLSGDGPKQYQCVIQTIWDSSDAPNYIEVVGRLIPLNDKTLTFPGGDERKQLPANSGEMTGKDAFYLINALKFMVYNVRLVDPSSSSVFEIDSEGNLFQSGYACYHIWNQEQRCVNCTSIKCLAFQKESSKIVFLDNEAIHVISQYVKVDGIPLVLETLTRITDDALLDEDGERLPNNSISDMYNKLYLDPVTQVYNRRYYNTKAQGPEIISALALLNVDHFKDINHTYGRTVGDNVLMHIAKSVSKEIRYPNILARYYGDEFVMMFVSIAPDVLETKLKKICSDISSLSVDGIEDKQHITVSIGSAVGPDIPAELLKKADEMLRKAKKHRNTVEIWSQETTDPLL